MAMRPEEDDDRRIRVAYLIDTISCSTSGTEKQLIEIIRRIDKSIFCPHLICLYESNWMRENPLPCPCTVLGYEGLLKPSLPGVLRSLRGLIVERRFRIIQTFFEDSIFVAWLATSFMRRGIILLSSRRDMGLGVENQPWYHRLFEMLLPLVNLGYDGIVANSRQVKEYVIKREKTSAAKIEVVYNGVDLPGPSNNAVPLIPGGEQEVRIAIVASLTPVKRHDVLIRAVSRLKPLLRETVLSVYVLGTGPEQERLVRLVQQEGVQEVFRFIGAVHNVTDYLRCVDIGVLCSDREGLSNAVLEYMASGLPVVATAVGGNTELVDDESGISVSADDPDALAAALHELILDRHRRHRLGAAARRRVIDDFSWHKSLQHLQGYYQRLVADKGTGP